MTRWTEADLQAYQGKARGGKARALTLTPQRRQEIAAAGGRAKANKYRNRKVTDATGAVHDSGKEYRRWCELQLRQRAGEISDLHRQRVFDLVVNGVLVCRYKADATYVEGGALVVEDTKPSDPKFRKTLAYRHFKLKALLMQAIHGIQIREV